MKASAEANALVAGVMPGLIRRLYSERRSGTLYFEKDKEECALRFAKGHIVYGEANSPTLQMGEVLVAQDLLAEENLVRAKDLALREHLKLGDALLALGIADLELLEEFLSFHVIAILTHVLSWSSGTYGFAAEDSNLGEAEAPPLKMTTGELVLEAVRRLGDREVIQFALGDPDRVLLVSTDPLVRFQRMPLNPTDAFVLSRVDGTLTARDIVGITPLGPQSVEQSLLCLLCTGMIEFTPSKAKREAPDSPQFLRQEILDAYESLSSCNHFELLGVSQDAQDADVKAAYFRLAKRYHPDVHHHLSLADLAGKVERVFLRLGEAYQAIGTEKARASYASFINPRRARTPDAVPVPAPPQAAPRVDEMLERARERFNDGKYWEAIAILGEVVPLAQEPLLSQARLLLAKGYLKYPEKEREAERELLEVTQAEPDQFEAFYLLGGFYQRKGLTARAEAMFRRVLELKPRHREAIAQLATLAPADRSKGGASILKRFFKKA